MVTLAGGGTMKNAASYTIGIGGTLAIDNLAAALNDRMRNEVGITIYGGTLEFRGNAATAVSEVIGALTIGASLTSTVTLISEGQPTSLAFAS